LFSLRVASRSNATYLARTLSWSMHWSIVVFGQSHETYRPGTGRLVEVPPAGGPGGLPRMSTSSLRLCRIAASFMAAPCNE
jgi:hypothetical protein